MLARTMGSRQKSAPRVRGPMRLRCWIRVRGYAVGRALVHGSAVELGRNVERLQSFTLSVDEAWMIRARNWQANRARSGTICAKLTLKRISDDA